jgi:phosphoglycolate phosphatase
MECNTGKECWRANKLTKINTSKYQNLLFDLDGTLTNPKEGIINSYMYSLKKMHLQENNPDSIASFIGSTLHSYFEDVHKLRGKMIDKAVSYYHEYYSVRGQFENEMYDGIPELLNKLTRQKKTLLLVTSKPTVFAESILGFFKIRMLFRNIFGSDTGSYNKSKTVLIKQAIMNENLNIEKCIMIGDRLYDIIGAKENNIASIAVTYGFGSKEELNKCSPKIIVDSVSNLTSIFS